MGTWGPGIFDDDFAGDVRNAYTDLIGEGRTPAQAIGILKREFADGVEDVEYGPVFWLVLAALQLEAGQVLDEVRAGALAAMSSESEINRWQGDPERERLFLSLRERLNA